MTPMHPLARASGTGWSSIFRRTSGKSSSAPAVQAGSCRAAGPLQTRTDFGAPGYGGPCPPEGDHPHRYLFTVFAVKAEKLDVKSDTSAAVVGFNLHFNTLAKAKIMGLFKR